MADMRRPPRKPLPASPPLTAPAGMLAAVEQALATAPEDPLAAWPYDGVAGTLPDWLLDVPHEGRDFLHHRDRIVRVLLDRAARRTEDDRTHEEVLAGAGEDDLHVAVANAVELLDRLDEVVASGDMEVSVTQRRNPATGELVSVSRVERRRESWERDAGGLRESLAHLARLRRCIRDGEIECLKRRAGGDAVLGRDVRERRRKGGKTTGEQRRKESKESRIRYMLSAGTSVAVIATRLKVSPQHVGRVRARMRAEKAVNTPPNDASGNNT